MKLTNRINQQRDFPATVHIAPHGEGPQEEHSQKKLDIEQRKHTRLPVGEDVFAALGMDGTLFGKIGNISRGWNFG